MVSQDDDSVLRRSEVTDGVVSSILTGTKAVELCPKPFRLVAKAKGFSKMEDLSNLQDLDYVDLRDNNFSSLEGISRIKRLKTVILKANCLSSVDDLGALSNIRVLNLAENKLTSLKSIADSSFAAELITLVLGGNQLRNIDAITAFPKLRTLVISKNGHRGLVPRSLSPPSSQSCPPRTMQSGRSRRH